MRLPDLSRAVPPAALDHGAAGEGGPSLPAANADREGLTIELATSELQIEATSSGTIPDEVGPTVVAIPIRNQLAAARIAHAFSNAREARALIDEAVELVATVRGLHVETYQLGAARGALRNTIELLARRARAEQDGGSDGPAPVADLKKDPSYEEIDIWLSFGIPVTS
jgi:hypothetical protein